MIKEKFVSQPQAIASYSYTDIAEGTGVIHFKGAQHREVAALSYMLTEQTVYSQEKTISHSETNGNGGSADHDFDVTFNKPQNLKGNVYLNLSLRITSAASVAYGKIIATIKHYDGTTETDLGTATTELVRADGGAADVKKICLVEIPITTLKHFKAGEILRVTIVVYASGNDGKTTTYLGIDPGDRTFGTMDSTVMSVYVPFRLEI